MNASRILIEDLGLDAVQFMEHVISRMPLEARVKAIQGIEAGHAQVEVRVRMRIGHDPRISLVLVSDDGEVEVTAGGGKRRE